MLARVTGLEPATSGVTGRRSNQLSYTRIGRPQRLFWPAMPVKGVWLEILRLMGISCGGGAGRHDFARKEAEPSRNDRLQSRDHERGADDSRHAYCGGDDPGASAGGIQPRGHVQPLSNPPLSNPGPSMASRRLLCGLSRQWDRTGGNNRRRLMDPILIDEWLSPYLTSLAK